MPGAEQDPIGDYIAAFPESERRNMEELRKIILEEAPGATQRMSYGMPTFHLGENLVHFACYAHHMGFYPTPKAIAEFAEELSGYKTSKGAIQFPLGREIRWDLVRKMVRFRVVEARLKMEAKRVETRKSS
ncbi:MAG TPA: DUF1801 domain-containing protein [Rectinemataceae bacterium]